MVREVTKDMFQISISKRKIGDPYEDFPDDEDRHNVSDDVNVALTAAQAIREAGNKLFKAGSYEAALNKYQSTFLSTHPQTCNTC
jgi:hypothetical protein